MNTIRYILYTVLCTVFLLGGMAAHSQELSPKEQRKLMKQLRQEEEAEVRARDAELVGLMLNHKQFVLEADQLRDRRGNLRVVSSMLNFIATDSTRGIIQVGDNTTMGLNGVGGITLEGPLRNYRVRYIEKRGIHYADYDVVTSTGTYHITVTARPDGRADATLTSNWAGALTYVGKLVPPPASRVYKGNTY